MPSSARDASSCGKDRARPLKSVARLQSATPTPMIALRLMRSARYPAGSVAAARTRTKALAVRPTWVSLRWNSL